MGASSDVEVVKGNSCVFVPKDEAKESLEFIGFHELALSRN